MEISFLGHSSFKLKGKTATVVTDPYGTMAGKFPKDITADIVTVSHGHEDHNQISNIQKSNDPVFVIQNPGEYEVKGVSVIGIPTWHDDKQGQERGRNIIYVIEIDGLRIAHLGDLGEKLGDEQLEEMGAIDIVMVPTGGVYTLDAKGAAEVIKQIDPWVAIPMHYADPALEIKTFADLQPVSEFLKAVDRPNMEGIAKYVVNAERLPTEFTVIWLLKK